MLQNLTRHTILAQRVSIADDPLKRMQGLLGQERLATGNALVISPCQSVHMLFMKFSIDVVFVDQDHHVVGLCPDLPPFHFSPIFWKSACAIELPAGTIKASQTQIGDKIAF